MPARMRVLFTALALVLAARPALAQDILIEGPRQLGTRDNFGQDLGPAGLLAEPLVGGGRYAIARGTAVDRRTGQVVADALGMPVAYDAARPRVFLVAADGIRSRDVVTGASELRIPRLEFFDACGYADSADVLVCSFFTTPGWRDLFVSEAGVLPRTIAVPMEGGWTITPDARWVFYRGCVAWANNGVNDYCSRSGLGRLDVATGVTRVVPASLDGAFLGDYFDPIWDAVNERVVAFGTVASVFTKDLVGLGTAPVYGRCRQLAISSHTGRMYLNRMDYYYSPPVSTLTAYDSTTYAPVAAPTARDAGYSCGPLRVLTAPGAPHALTASVSGRSVTLSWINVGGASSFQLEFGLAPGRTDGAVTLGPAPHATFAGVPAGVYYVRVRGANEFGAGRVSADVRVVVP